MTVFDGKTVLVTGGTGSFGTAFTTKILAETQVKKLIVFSRDELKQYEMAKRFEGEERIRFFIGDVRDAQRLERAFHGVDYVVHAAALKHVTAAEYNPMEAVKTNIYGAQNIINAAIDQGVKKVVALSTDKASSPINLYGATKLVSDKLFVAGNAYSGVDGTRFSVVRYGNVVGSRGSVVPYFKGIAHCEEIPITDERMTRFWITLEHGVQFVMDSFARMRGGEIFVPKIASMRVTDLARVIAPSARLKIIGIRPGEKIHEQMISVDDARRTRDMGDYFIIQPEFEWWLNGDAPQGEAMPDGFSYVSDTNSVWLTSEQLAEMVNRV